MIGPLGQILVVSQALGEIGDGHDAVGVRGRDQGHESVTDNGAGLGLVGEGAGEVADRDDQGLPDEVRVEGHSGHLIELDEQRPLVDDVRDRLPEGRVGLDEPGLGLVLAYLKEPKHLRLRMLAVVQHPLVVVEAEGLGLVIVVEDLLVHLPRHGILGRKLVLDRLELQVAVRIADGLLELIGAVVREVAERITDRGRRPSFRSAASPRPRNGTAKGAAKERLSLQRLATP